ncbi:hypothetical protein VP01_1994g1 [Puccinia sorghi]|uniref:Uncharacterized protein n=1 Tax=Puccinia sorghi TaxID=27349 RepID=A0A0L6VBP2_9BASI|nr:hypothetical protein VP01_1994g1 [Puccinia sorghi]
MYGVPSPDIQIRLYSKYLARLPVPNSPGPNSNYIDWELVIVMSFLDAANLEYIVLTPMPEVPSPSQASENKIVFSVITQQKISNTFNKISGMLTACGLINRRSSALFSKASSDKTLNSLILKDSPLNPNDVHSVALLSSITQNWLHCVSFLLNQNGSYVAVSASAAKAFHPFNKKPFARPKKPHNCFLCNINRSSK